MPPVMADAVERGAIDDEIASDDIIVDDDVIAPTISITIAIGIVNDAKPIGNEFTT